MEKTKTTPYEEMENAVELIVRDYITLRDIKLHLTKHGILNGRVEQVLSDISLLEKENVDIREVILFAEQFYQKTGLQSLNPKNWWTENELRVARQYYPLRKEEEYDLPHVLKNVSLIEHNVYSVALDVKTIAKWMETMVLAYNYDIQRQSTKKIRRGSVIERPTINHKNVDEIRTLIGTGELVVTTLALNAAVGSSDNGDELLYNKKENTLTIAEGTRIDVLDGFHRCLACVGAYNENNDIDFRFNVLFSNYTTQEAQQYQAQLSKATPIPQSRADELEASKLAVTTIQQLRVNSDLRGRISSGASPKRSVGELVSHETLLEAIDEQFKMNTRADAHEVAEWLGMYFDVLIGNNPEVFLSRKRDMQSVMSANQMFYGYIALASEMKNRDIEPTKIKDIIKQVDFSRENDLWVDLKLIDKNKNIQSSFNKDRLVEYFKRLEL